MGNPVPPANQFLPLTKLGIVRCRDLVQLYYGARMVTAIVEKQSVLSTTSVQQILAPDPRRIKYEVVFACNPTGPDDFEVGGQTACENGQGQEYNIAANTSIRIERSFLTDLDEVSDSLYASGDNGNITVSTREVFLQPLPVDEPV